MVTRFFLYSCCTLVTIYPVDIKRGLFFFISSFIFIDWCQSVSLCISVCHQYIRCTVSSFEGCRLILLMASHGHQRLVRSVAKTVTLWLRARLPTSDAYCSGLFSRPCYVFCCWTVCVCCSLTTVFSLCTQSSRDSVSRYLSSQQNNAQFRPTLCGRRRKEKIHRRSFCIDLRKRLSRDTYISHSVCWWI